MKKISQGSASRKAIAMALISASFQYKENKRIREGRALSHARGKQSDTAAAFQRILASIMTLILWPLNLLAQKVVFSKVLASVCIRKVAISGGGSLARNVDKFFEAFGITVLNGYGLTETSPVAALAKQRRLLAFPLWRERIRRLAGAAGNLLIAGVMHAYIHGI